MTFQPTTRQGLLMLAFEKHTRYGGAFLYFVVSTMLDERLCSQGLSAGPIGLADISVCS